MSKVTIILDAKQDIIKIEQALFQIGSVDPRAIAQEIIAEIAIKMLSGTSLSQARSEVLIELMYLIKQDYGYEELNTIFKDVGLNIVKDVYLGDDAYYGTQRRWRCAEYNNYYIILELEPEHDQLPDRPYPGGLTKAYG